MPMLKGQRARQEAGIIAAHANAIAKVATDNRCIIGIREPGKAGAPLIEEGYSSKDYHIKAKSCNWGPMAGFVCCKAMFSKRWLQYGDNDARRRGTQWQEAKVESALEDGARCRQLVITDHRRTQLEQLGYIERDHRVTRFTNDRQPNRVFRYRAKMDGFDDNKFLASCLRKAAKVEFYLKEWHPDDQHDPCWKLLYLKPNLDRAPLYPVYGLESRYWNPDVQKNYMAGAVEVAPYRAARNNPVAPPFKRPTSGDYDLFCVWPLGPEKDEYKYQVGGRALLHPTHAQYQKMDPDKGNISQLVIEISRKLNNKINANRWGDGNFRYKGGNMIHHSDEAGRPGLGDDGVDLPVIFFFPDAIEAYDPICLFEDKEQFTGLVDWAMKRNSDLGNTAEEQKKRINLILNPGWVDDIKDDGTYSKADYDEYLLQELPRGGLED